jgi:murein hydrolase activator
MPRRRLPAGSLLLPAALLMLAAQPASAQAPEPPRNPVRALEGVERDLREGQRRDAELAREAERLAAEMGALRARLIRTAEDAGRLEEELAELEEKLRILAEQETVQLGRLEEERERIAGLLGALQRLSRVPTEALVMRPEAPIDTLRSALLLRSTVPELERRAEALRGAIRHLADLRADIAARRARAGQARAELAERSSEMQALVAQRQELAARNETERGRLARRAAGLAAQAGDLRELLERLEAEREAAAAEERRRAEAAARAAAEAAARERAREQETRAAAVAARPPEAPGDAGEARVPLPVAGTVRLRYGESDRFGNASRGLRIEARPGAAVVSPHDGSIMFAGPFKGYGQILIVEHANGYHSLIAGLGRIDAGVGQQVLAGEPVGAMAASQDGNPDLYYELRRNGQPINPQRGLSALGGKGHG